MKFTIIAKKTVDELQDNIIRKQKTIAELNTLVSELRNKTIILEKTVAQLRWNERDRKGCYLRNKISKQNN